MKTIYDLACWVKNQNIDLKICWDKGKFRVRVNDRFNGESKTLEQAFENCMIELRMGKPSAPQSNEIHPTPKHLLCPTCGNEPAGSGGDSNLLCSGKCGKYAVTRNTGDKVYFGGCLSPGFFEFDGINWVRLP